MTGIIIDAICNELQALFADTGNTVLRDTNFKISDIPMYTMPCILVGIASTNEYYQCSGGATRGDWDMDIKAFFYDFNANLGNDDGYSTSDYDIVETINKHFAKQSYLSQKMIDAVNNYSLKMTINGTVRNDELEYQGGVIPGYTITYNTVAIDQATNWVSELTTTSQTVTGSILFDDIPHTVLFQKSVLAILTEAQYIALTHLHVGDRYYISDSNVIRNVLTITPTVTVKDEIMQNNWILFSDADDYHAYWYNNNELVMVESESVVY